MCRDNYNHSKNTLSFLGFINPCFFPVFLLKLSCKKSGTKLKLSPILLAVFHIGSYFFVNCVAAVYSYLELGTL